MRPLLRIACTGALIPALTLLPRTDRGSRETPIEQGARIRVILRDTALLRATWLDESSGVAPSSTAGVFWTINDSGNGPMLFATDTTGADLGALRVTGAENRDWEDLAAGPCVVEPGVCLYIADIGDNAERRRRVVVYRLREPAIPRGADDTGRSVLLLDSLTLTYPDRPHNAEGLAVTPDGRVLIATKDQRQAPRLLSTPPATRAWSGRLTPVCRLALSVEPWIGRQVTGLAVSPNGRFLVARTYVSLHAFRADSACTPLTNPRGVAIPVVESQGEAVTFDGPAGLVLTSERAERHALLTRLRIDGLSP